MATGYEITITTKASIAGVTGRFPLGAVIDNLQRGDDDLRVHWTASSGNFVSGSNDQLVAIDQNDNTKGINSGTQLAAVNAPVTVTFMAYLMASDETTVLATSNPYTVRFMPLDGFFQFVIDKSFAPTIGSGAIGPNNLIKATVTVTDTTGNPVTGAEVHWVTVPETSFFSVYQDSMGTIPALTDGGHPYTLSSALTGEATAYLADKKTHQYVLRPRILGSHVSPQTSMIFAGTDGEDVNYDSFTLSGIETDPFGKAYLNIIDSQSSFTALPGSDVASVAKNDFFFVLLNDTIIIDTKAGSTTGGLELSYAALKAPLQQITQNIPSENINNLVFFIQNNQYGNVAMSEPISFYGIGNWPGNVPTTSQEAPRTLPHMQITPPPGNGVITTDTINEITGLTVEIPALPSTFEGKTVTFLFYLNGYKQGTDDERHGGPDMPGLTQTAIIDENGKATASVPWRYVYGYATSKTNNKILASYVDYYIDVNSSRYYCRYPVAYLTNTVYP